MFKFGKFLVIISSKIFWGLSFSLLSFWYSRYVYAGFLHGILPFSETDNSFLSLCSLDLNLVQFLFCKVFSVDTSRNTTTCPSPVTVVINNATMNKCSRQTRKKGNVDGSMDLSECVREQQKK